jgi:hypothetical protein
LAETGKIGALALCVRPVLVLPDETSLVSLPNFSDFNRQIDRAPVRCRRVSPSRWNRLPPAIVSIASDPQMTVRHAAFTNGDEKADCRGFVEKL